MPPKKSQPKKKKPVSNRGFATVSVPRKKDAEEPEVAPVEEEPAASGDAKLGDQQLGERERATGGADDAGPKDEWDTDPEAMERHELQGLADKIRPGVDKEVARVTKVSRALRAAAKAR